MKKYLLLCAVFVLAISVAWAQERTVSGKVTSADDGSGVPGVNVVLSGTTNGTITDVDGNFKLTIPSDGGVLTFSFVGMKTQDVTVGSRSVIDVQMQSDFQELGEVVVTALGITKEKASLGYGVTTIGSEAVAQRPEADIARILRGKAPGVEISQASGMSGTGTNVIIRGFSSITGSNQPLFVVDGIPINSDTNSDLSTNVGSATASSRFLDLDPNNVAEVSILKGLSATVLYGEAGKNGVVLITTKTGSSSTAARDFDLEVDQGVAWSQIANLPEYQNSYGNGFGDFHAAFFSNWGPHFDTRGEKGIAADGTIGHPYDVARLRPHFPEFIGVRYPYVPYENVENFYETGLASNTSVIMRKNLGEGASLSFSYGNQNDKGFIPDNKNEFIKNNFALGGNMKLANGLMLNSSFSYIESNRAFPTAAVGFGSNPVQNSLFANLIYTPRNLDLQTLPFQSPIDGTQAYYRTGGDMVNPYWTLYNTGNNENVKRFIGSATLRYEITDWLSATYRIGVDQYSQWQRRYVNKGGVQTPNGALLTSERLVNTTDHVLNLNLNKDLGENFNLDVLFGYNARRVTKNFTFANSTQQFVFDIFEHSNFSVHNNSSYLEEVNTLGAYGTLSLGYKGFVYLNFQGRNDWTSTIEKDNRSIFYPSVSASFIPTDAFAGLSGSAVNFLKIRVGYGTSAGYPRPYRTRNILNTATNQFLAPDGTRIDINSVSNALGNPDLAPELHTELELGLEGRFMNDRVGLDLSFYDKVSKDLILGLNLDPATGYTITEVNGAEITNRGWEIQLNLVPVRGAFTWELSPNFTRNRNNVVAVFEGVDQLQVGNAISSTANWAIPGQHYGMHQGFPYERSPNGAYIVGLQGSYNAGPAIEVIGDPNSKWTGNLSSTMSWKGISFYMQWSYQHGGDIFSMTTATFFARGNTKDTDVDRSLAFILPGEIENPDGTFRPNDIQIYLGDESFNAYFFADEGGIFDATNIRLREVTLSYALPSSILSKTPFGNVELRASGQNLFFKAVNFPEYVNYDPDVISTGVSNSRGMEYITGPTVKRYSVGLRVTL